MLGAACGDALGATLEFQLRGVIASQYPDGFRDIIGGGWLGLAPGETTDDTAMMLAIARACTRDGIDLDQVAANFVAWMRTGPRISATRRVRRSPCWRQGSGGMRRASACSERVNVVLRATDP